MTAGIGVRSISVSCQLLVSADESEIRNSERWRKRFAAFSEHFFKKFVDYQDWNDQLMRLFDRFREKGGSFGINQIFQPGRRVDHVHNRSDSRSMTDSNPLKKPRSSADNFSSGSAQTDDEVIGAHVLELLTEVRPKAIRSTKSSTWRRQF